MTENKTCLNWQAPGLPFDSGLPGAVAAFHDGRDYALELLGYVETVQRLQGYSVEQQSNMARAALCGFLAPLLPLMADSLCLMASANRHDTSPLAALVGDLVDGAALALDLASTSCEEY
ncbi:hypothetical protein [Paludibacterium denitrificans]|uniref:Uncharacterized protein n=1 Tax=Paludibacterium denitrificans TaxID=2675226 RepID=A0A844GEA6_9NEIS|nr:hypothetical protein [Paludibacterium denitrificans]MTD33247.1 hypothetical protein [Paludibacterium denitrificans]